jgi:hypothetical protein
VSTAGTYTLSCAGAGGSCQTQTVSVTPPLACTNPSATITATPNRVQAGSSVTLSYSATGVDTGCTITGPGLSQTVSPNTCLVSPNTVQAPNVTTQSTFKISCDSGESVAQAIVNVVPKFEDF